MRPVVLVPYVSGQLRDETLEALRQADAILGVFSLDAEDQWAYANLLRAWWREPTNTLICEHDVVPAPGAIRQLAECDEPWCTFPHWIEDHYQLDTLGLAKFHLLLKVMHHDLAEAALARPDPRIWVRQGHTHLDPDCSNVILGQAGRRACLRQEVGCAIDPDDPPPAPATVDWTWCDTALSRELRRRGITPHVHQPPPRHLHLYAQQAPDHEA